METQSLITCVHCGINYCDRAFQQVPVNGRMAITIACTQCFWELPIEEVAEPKLHDYLKWATEHLSNYQEVVKYLRGKEPENTNAFFAVLHFNTVKETHDPPGSAATPSW